MLQSIAHVGQARFYFPFDLDSPKFKAEIERTLPQAQRDLDTVKAPIIVPQSFQEFTYSKTGSRNDSLVVGMHLQASAPIVAQYWYGRPDSGSTYLAAYPRPGVLTVISSVEVCAVKQSISCERQYNAWRHLYQEFAPRGVDFILLTHTTGSFGSSTLLSPEAEVDSLKTYFRNRLKLPGILGIQVTQFQTLPDGRKVPVFQPSLGFGIVMRNGLLWLYGAVLSYSNGFTNWENFLNNQLLMQAAQ
jgi:hypothetical protein